MPLVNYLLQSAGPQKGPLVLEVPELKWLLIKQGLSFPIHSMITHYMELDSGSCYLSGSNNFVFISGIFCKMKAPGKFEVLWECGSSM